MKSLVVKRSVIIHGHKTSVSLEDAFFDGLKQAAKEMDMTLFALVEEIDNARKHTNLSSAVRLFVFDRFRRKVLAEKYDFVVAPLPAAGGS